MSGRGKEIMTAQKSLRKNAALNMTKTVMGLIFPLITFPYVSRVLEPSGIGKINFAHSIVSYFSMIAALGISTYGVREAAKVRDDKMQLTKFVKEILSINIISTIAAYILLFLSLLIVPRFSEYRRLLAVCGASILFVTLGVEWLYTALEEFAYITARSIIFQIISVVLMFVFIRTRDDYLKYAAIGVISSVGSNICNFIHAWKYVSFGECVQKELKKHIKPIFTLFAMSVAVSIYTALDTTMLGLISGDEQVGFYAAATRVNKIVVSVITAAVTVLLPRLSFYVSKHDEEHFSVLSAKALNAVILLAFPCAVGLSLVARPVILLLSGARYELAIPTMRIMNPIIIAISLSGLIGIQIFMPLGRERLTLISVILGAVINFALNLVLIPSKGALGAGIATVCAESSVTVFQIVCARRIFAFKKILPHAAQCVLASALMSVAVYFLLKTDMGIVLQLACSGLVGMAVYVLALLLLRNQFCLSL